MSENIDKIFYINLDKRTDRREEIEQELSNYELNAERYAGIYTPHSGIVGCGYSHLNVLKLAKERGYKNVLILEDDFQFVVSKEEFEEFDPVLVRKLHNTLLETQEGLNYYKKALYYAEKMKDSTDIINTKINIVSAYYAINKYDEGINDVFTIINKYLKKEEDYLTIIDLLLIPLNEVLSSFLSENEADVN